MVLLIGCVAAVIYCTVALLIARYLYGMDRAEKIDKYASRGYRNPVEMFEESDAAGQRSDSLIYGVMWPLTGLIALSAWVTVHVVGGSKTKSKYEIDLASKAKDEKIAQLERELNLVDEQRTPDLLQDGFERHNHQPSHIRRSWD